MARAPRASLWVLNRFPPSASRWSEVPELQSDSPEGPLGVPLEGFADKKDAEAAAERRERMARETTPIGPFLRGLLPDGTGAIASAARAANLPPPDFASLGPAVTSHTGYGPTFFEYVERAERVALDWWASVAADITPQANAILWDELFPSFRFFTVSRVLFEE
ncbi:MAG: hypothetical protein J0I06_00615 [Planctomycetes bacterium]|nr:hypothetical protein [Planctomycetota bacterium]